MSETVKDGGQAFPYGDWANGGESGMSLRDWFAGQALASLGDWTPLNEDGSGVDWTDLSNVRKRRARWAYDQADAMLAARFTGVDQ